MNKPICQYVKSHVLAHLQNILNIEFPSISSDAPFKHFSYMFESDPDKMDELDIAVLRAVNEGMNTKSQSYDLMIRRTFDHFLFEWDCDLIDWITS